MKLVILTQYYPPEVGAPQNRLYELAVRLQKKGVEVTILTAMPNYPSMKIHEDYKGKLYKKETKDDITIHRAWIYVTASKGVFKRLLNYFSFVFTSFWIGLFKLPKHDFLLVESPPLFLGISAYSLSRLRRSRMIFNVSDLWPESAEKLGIVTNKTFLGMAQVLEMFLYKKSVLITGQTQGICKNIQSRLPQKDVYWLPNGVDISYYDSEKTISNFRSTHGFNDKHFLLLYAGIIGHAQGLEVIVKAAQLLKEKPEIQFLILGSGPEKEGLIELVKKLSLSNVVFLDLVEKSQMPAIVSAVDAAIIPLKRLDLFLGAIPSKIFENLAMKKAILLGVEGEAKTLFIEQGKAGIAFEPENETELVSAILQLYNSPSLCKELGENGLKFVTAHFTRDLIAEKFLKKINEVQSKFQ